MEKPIFNIEEIKAEVKGIATIEENIEKVKDFAINLQDYYSKLVFNKEDIKLAKEEKSNVNKLKKKIDDVRKDITKEFNKPLEVFIDTAKETVSILDDTYNMINNQVIKYETEDKEKTKEKLVALFNEYIEYHHLEALYIPFEACNINITLSASMKSLENAVISFVERIATDVKVIGLETNYRDDILHEYLNNGYNFADAKMNVLNRVIEIDRIKEQNDKLVELQKEEEKIVAKVDEILMPTEIKEQVEETIEVTFTAYLTKEQVKELKQWFIERGIKYV